MRTKDGHMCDYCGKPLFGSTIMCMGKKEYHPSCLAFLDRIKRI